MFRCLAMCFSAYTSRFSCTKNFSTNFFCKIFVEKAFFLKSCSSLTAPVQRGTFSFALSIPFIARPMHYCCTVFQPHLGSFCITLSRWSACTNPFEPKDTNNYFGS